MAVTITSVGKIGESVSKEGEREFRQTLELLVTTTPGPAAAMAVSAYLDANGYARGTELTTGSNVFLTNRTSDPTGDKYKPSLGGWKWTSSITWTTAPVPSDSSKPPDQGKAPWERRPEIEVFIAHYTEKAQKEIVTNQPVTNSAKDPVTREKKRGRLAFRISKNFENYDFLLLREPPTGLLYSRNQAAWTPGGPYTDVLGSAVVGAGAAMIVDMKEKILFHEGDSYVNISAEIHVDANQHKDIFVDQGYAYLDVFNRRHRFTDSTGFATAPKLLNGAGGPRLDTDPNIYYGMFQYYPLADWSTLGLP